MIGRMFKRVTWRAFVAAAVVLLGVPLIWQQAPRLAIDGRSPFATPTARAWLIVALFALWAVVCGVRWLVRAMGRMRIVWHEPESKPETLTDEKADSEVRERRAAKETCHQLARGFAAALRVVRRGGPASRFGRHSVYRLPWYLVIGAQASGKTALLHASDLKFSLDDTVAAAQEASAPHQWWFADEAVLLEASGCGGADRPVWDLLLRKLKRVRRRCAINGVIVTVSARVLLDGDDADRTACATAMRERIDAMHRTFGIRFPIYVVVTHSDLLPGFDVFFDELPHDERVQVWGVTFPAVDDRRIDAPLAVFSDEFDALTRQLQIRLIDRMPARSNLERSAAMYGFPLRFAALGEPLARWLNDAFGASPYAPHALLRGVYLTAASNAAAQGTLCSSDARRGYFITRLLREVVFHESHLAGSPLAVAGRRIARRRAAAVAIAMLAIAIGVGMVSIYERNAARIAQTALASDELANLAQRGVTMDEPLSMLPLLDAARDLPGGYAQRAAPVPLFSRFGPHQSGPLGAIAQAQYRSFLRETVQPFIAERGANALRSGELEPSKRYGLLRAYLMLGDRTHYDAATVLARTKRDVDGLALTSPQRADFVDHAAALFDDTTFKGDVPLDAALIAQARGVGDSAAWRAPFRVDSPAT